MTLWPNTMPRIETEAPGGQFRRAAEEAQRRSSRSRGLLRLGILGGCGLILALLLTTLPYAWNWSVVWTYRALFYQGFAMTLAVSAGAMVLGSILGLAGGLCRVSGNMLLSEPAALYVEIFRGTPLLVQIYIFYFCVTTVIRYDNVYVVGTATLALFAGAYLTEMVRSGIESVDQGQWEAALATGLTQGQTLRRVVLPQALRRVIPPLAGQFASLIKDSSLLSVISIRELTKAAEVVNATTYKTFEAYLPLALCYLALTWPLTKLTYRLERWLEKGLERRYGNAGGQAPEPRNTNGTHPGPAA